MTTPEPSTLEPLTDAELDALAKRRWSREKWHRAWQGFVKVSPDELKRLIAQARAAQSALDHAATSLDRYNEANAALQHMAACQPYLKEGEYPEECIERWRKDCNALMTVLAQRTKELEEARAGRPSPWQPIETAPKDGTWIVVLAHALRDHHPVAVRWSQDVGDGESFSWNDGMDTIVGGPLSWQPIAQPLPSPPAQDGGRP